MILHRTEKYLLHCIFYERLLAFGRDYPAMPISRLGRHEFRGGLPWQYAIYFVPAPSFSMVRQIHRIRCRRRLVEYLIEQLPREDNGDCEDINFAHYNETIQSPSLIWSLNS